MEKRFVIPLEEIQDSDTAAVGGKARSLARLTRMGLSVPHGFCITADSYREHIKNNKIIPQFESALGKLEHADFEDKRNILSNIRHAIIEKSLSDSLLNMIRKHHNNLKADSLAVRSSATAEDLPSHSFAGQYETYLGITDLAGCIDAVKKCWASLWTLRAYEYRQKNGFDHLAVNMAVIVQELVQADASGVIFTADPVNGYKSRIIIETVPGLGDTLVSGKATPLRFVVARKKCRIVSKNLISEPCITDSVVKRIAKLGQKIEKRFGSPQDIEWAISENKIFFLQARPVTVIPLPKSWEERQVWTNAAIRDVAPDVVTPATWSMMEEILESLLKPLFNFIAVNIGDNLIGGVVAGRIYLNINTFMAIFQDMPDWFHTSITKSVGGQHQKQFSLGQIDIPDEDLPDIKLNPLKVLFCLPRIIYMLYTHRISKSHVLLERLAEINKINRKRNPGEMDQAQLVEAIFDITKNEFSKIDLCYLFPLSWLPVLYFICRRWLGDENDQLANSLSAGTGQMKDVQAGIALWNLAQQASSDSTLKETILATDNWLSLCPLLESRESGRTFLKSWDEFMAQHGHHCRGEILLFNPRWYETPDYILSIVKSYMESHGIHNPVSDLEKKIIHREQLVKATVKKLKNPVKRILLRHAVTKTRKGLIFRENVKSEIVRLITTIREILLELGRKFTTEQILEKCDDIFFLRLDELAAVAEKRVDFDIHQTIKNRRLEYEKYKSLTPPEIVIGRFNPDTYVPEEIDTRVTVLKGTSACPGIVKGPARVILRADENQHVQPGEILVAPFTDPGWTPYFIPAAAIVMDQGGMLSHGSIIAREYGIPAVVNVGPATKIIKTGQMIQVDANRGVVTILR